MSSVEIVEQAIAEKDKAYRDRDNAIQKIEAKARKQVTEAIRLRQDAENALNRTTALLKRNSFLYLGLLAGVLFLLSIKSKTFVTDLIDFFKVPILTLSHLAFDYFAWLHIPTYSKHAKVIAFSPEWSWVLRIVTPLLIIASLIGIIFLIRVLICFYRQRWCTLSLKVWVLCYAVLVIFGDTVRFILPINLILLLLFSQIVYLIVLKCLDTYYKNRYRSHEWDEIQNR